MAKYRFHWLDGTVNEGEGTSVSDAFTHLGFGGGAIRALDYHEEIKGAPIDPLDEVMIIKLLQKKVGEETKDPRIADKIIRKLEELL